MSLFPNDDEGIKTEGAWHALEMLRRSEGFRAGAVGDVVEDFIRVNDDVSPDRIGALLNGLVLLSTTLLTAIETISKTDKERVLNLVESEYKKESGLTGP